MQSGQGAREKDATASDLRGGVTKGGEEKGGGRIGRERREEASDEIEVG